SRGVATPAYACEHVVGIRMSHLFLQLAPDLFADDGLKTCDHVGIRMRTDNRSDNIMSIRRVVDPMAHRFVGSILERHAPACRGYNLRTEDAHTFYIRTLSFHIDLTHVDDTLHAH